VVITVFLGVPIWIRVLSLISFLVVILWLIYRKHKDKTKYLLKVRPRDYRLRNLWIPLLLYFIPSLIVLGFTIRVDYSIISESTRLIFDTASSVIGFSLWGQWCVVIGLLHERPPRFIMLVAVSPIIVRYAYVVLLLLRGFGIISPA